MKCKNIKESVNLNQKNLTLKKEERDGKEGSMIIKIGFMKIFYLRPFRLLVTSESCILESFVQGEAEFNTENACLIYLA